MGGNKEGAKKAVETRRKKYGADYEARIGAIGGSRKVKKGFAMMKPEDRAEFYRKRSEKRYKNES